MFKVYFSKNKTVLKSLLEAFLPLSTQNSIQEVEILKDKQLEKTIQTTKKEREEETTDLKHHRQLYLPLFGKKQTNRIGS